MSEKITPALTAEQWRNADPNWRRPIPAFSNPEDLRAYIACANAILPDDDPRKITRGMIDRLREGSSDKLEADALDIADALESYLPPSETNG